MAVRRRKFAPPTVPGRRSQSGTIRTDIIRPTLGLNTSAHPANLRPGEAAESENFALSRDGGAVAVRDGLEEVLGPFVDNGFDDLTDIQGATRFPSNDTQPVSVIRLSSALTDYFHSPDGGDFSAAGPTAGASFTTDPSRFKDFHVSSIDSHQAFDLPSTIITAGLNHRPYYHQFSEGNFRAREFLDLSTTSRAKYVTGFDERVVFFHCNADAQSKPKQPRRVVWSQRGDAEDYADGGFQDLVEMQGQGTGLVAERDRLVLTSDRDVWIARPRRDHFAFDFIPITQSVGNKHPRTLEATESGSYFVGPDLMVYRLVGNEVRPVGAEVQEKLKDELREEDLLWASYDDQRSLYRIFYSDTTGEYPSKSLDLRVDTVEPIDRNRDRGVWFAQSYRSNQLWAGDRDVVGSLPQSSASTGRGLQFADRPEDFVPQTGASDTSYRYGGVWRSGALEQQDVNRKEQLTEVWAEIESSTTTASFNHHIRVYSDLSSGPSSSATASVAHSGRTDIHFPVAGEASRHVQMEYRTPSGVTGGYETEARAFRLSLRAYTGRF